MKETEYEDAIFELQRQLAGKNREISALNQRVYELIELKIVHEAHTEALKNSCEEFENELKKHKCCVSCNYLNEDGSCDKKPCEFLIKDQLQWRNRDPKQAGDENGQIS